MVLKKDFSIKKFKNSIKASKGIKVFLWGLKMSVYIIVEIGVNHNGDLSLAKQLIEQAKFVGADAVKFQTDYCRYN